MSIVKTIFNINRSIFFRPDKFYCKVELGSGMYFKIWERPGKWMNEEKMNQLIADIIEVATKGQGDKDIPDYGVLKGDKEDLKNRVITIAYEKSTNKPVAFAAQIFLEVPIGLTVVEVLHLGLVFVAKDFQKKSILGLLYILPNILLLLKRGFRPLWISNVSQVPAAIGVVSDYYEGVYPNPIHETKQSLMQRSLSLGIIKNHYKAFGTGPEAEFDIDRQVIMNSYSGGSDNLKKTFEESPKYRNEKVNIFCYKELNYERGDDFLQIGTLSGKLIHNFFLKRVAGVSPFQWFLYLFVATIFTILLPILRWLTRKPE